MSATTGTRDPRSIVTPHAFGVSEDLFGMPLASPRRRLAALLLDLIVVSILTSVTRSFALVLGAAVAVLFVQAGFKRTNVRNSVFGRAMRFSVGCLGLVIGLVVMIIWASLGPGGFGDDDDDDGPAVQVTVDAEGDLLSRFASGALRIAVASSLAEAEDFDMAENVIEDYIEASEELDRDPAEVRADLLGAIPEGASWAEAAIDLVVDRLGEEATDESGDEEEIDAAGVVAGLSLGEALQRYGALASLDDPSDTEEQMLEELGARLAPVIAADTLEELEDRVDDLQDDVADRTRRLEATEAALAEQTSGGLLTFIRDFADDLGFGFGWWSFYMTVLLSFWNGQTVGKRALGIRVVRLDGEPINWWVAFERGGGYVAGFATGLLGFAQVFWDANRQAIHDRIVGTVVVREGAERVTDWEEAL